MGLGGGEWLAGGCAKDDSRGRGDARELEVTLST